MKSEDQAPARFNRTAQPATSDALVVAHSIRFRKVSNLYPRLVAVAYGRDIAKAAAATDIEVAEQVALWERENGRTVTNWNAVGRHERDEIEGGDPDEGSHTF